MKIKKEKKTTQITDCESIERHCTFQHLLVVNTSISWGVWDLEIFIFTLSKLPPKVSCQVYVKCGDVHLDGKALSLGGISFLKKQMNNKVQELPQIIPAHSPLPFSFFCRFCPVFRFLVVFFLLKLNLLNGLGRLSMYWWKWTCSKNLRMVLFKLVGCIVCDIDKSWVCVPFSKPLLEHISVVCTSR